MACVAFNFVLALVNASVHKVSSGLVIGVQLALTIALGWQVVLRRPKMSIAAGWALLLIVVSTLILGLTQGGINAQALYEAVSVPLFILAGGTIRAFPLRTLKRFFWFVLLIAAFEVLLPNVYMRVVNPLSYYRNTRAWVANGSDDNGDSYGFYVGAMRAGGNFFSFMGDHRLGSIFLEPLSLGYFALLCAVFFFMLYRDRFLQKLYWLIPCLALSLLADTRVSTVLILVAFALSIPKVYPRWIPYAATPAFFAISIAIYLASKNIVLVGGDLWYRLSLTFGAFQQISIFSLLTGGVPTSHLNDSGFLYMVYNYGLLGALCFYAMATGLLGYSWRSKEYLPLALSGYMVISSLFGGAMLAIKAASFLGLMVGYFGSAKGAEAELCRDAAV
jgi:hypothetical protein